MKEMAYFLLIISFTIHTVSGIQPIVSAYEIHVQNKFYSNVGYSFLFSSGFPSSSLTKLEAQNAANRLLENTPLIDG